MKNLLKYMIPCLMAIFALSSCYDTMDDKASIDAAFERATSASVSLTSAVASDFQTINAIGSVSNSEEVIETGIQISETADFSDNLITAHDTLTNAFNITVSGMKEQTTYYVRGYAVTKTAGTIVTEAQTVTTPKVPIFTIDGTYIAHEMDLNDNDEWEDAGAYEMTISFDENDPTIVNISNIWDGGMTVQGQYDAATGNITVPNMQVIYVHATYGDVWLRGVTPAIDNYTSSVIFNFTALGGKMVSTPMAAQCEAGNFGFFYLEMEHQ